MYNNFKFILQFSLLFIASARKSRKGNTIFPHVQIIAHFFGKKTLSNAYKKNDTLKSAILIFCVIDDIIGREARSRRELGV